MASLAVLASCSTHPPAAPEPVAVDRLPGFSADDLAGLDGALRAQCALKAPPAPWPALCAELAARPDLRDWLTRRFRALPLHDADRPEGLLTGYYEPLLTGSLNRESATQVPLLAPPDDLLTIDLEAIDPALKGKRLRGRLDGRKVVPYASRAQIDSAASPPGRALVWVDDPVDAFFLEIQGSGRVRLRDGALLRVGYADQNGHPYRAIGSTLVSEFGVASASVNAPSIKAWLRGHPGQARRVMESNPSKVFFQARADRGDPDAGPPGALRVPLTPMRSVAVDPSRVPLGSLVYLDAVRPDDGSPWRRMAVAQDTGGAIRGGARADLFWGFGPAAEAGAGHTKSPLKMWVLQPVDGTGPAGR